MYNLLDQNFTISAILCKKTIFTKAVGTQAGLKKKLSPFSLRK